MYRWIDDNGKVVYSQQPPPDQRATKEIKPPPPPAVDTKTAREKLDRSLQAQEDRREDRKLAADKSKKAKEQAQEKSKVCQDAKDNLAKLAQGGNRLYKNPEGEYQRLDDKARSDLVKKAQEAIKKACKD